MSQKEPVPPPPGARRPPPPPTPPRPMFDSALSIKTNPELLRLLERARLHVMTPKEVYDQRVSFIWGQLKPDSGVTVEHIKAQLAREGIVDPEIAEQFRRKMLELCDRFAWRGPSRETNLEITIREARALGEKFK